MNRSGWRCSGGNDAERAGAGGAGAGVGASTAASFLTAARHTTAPQTRLHNRKRDTTLAATEQQLSSIGE